MIKFCFITFILITISSNILANSNQDIKFNTRQQIIEKYCPNTVEIAVITDSSESFDHFLVLSDEAISKLYFGSEQFENSPIWISKSALLLNKQDTQSAQISLSLLDRNNKPVNTILNNMSKPISTTVNNKVINCYPLSINTFLGNHIRLAEKTEKIKHCDGFLPIFGCSYIDVTRLKVIQSSVNPNGQIIDNEAYMLQTSNPYSY